MRLNTFTPECIEKHRYKKKNNIWSDLIHNLGKVSSTFVILAPLACLFTTL